MGIRARAAAALAVYVLALFQPVAAAAQTTTTTTTNFSIPVVEKITTASNYLAKSLQTIAYAMIIIAGFVGIIHWVTGRGPDYLVKAILAAIGVAFFLWLVGYIMG